MLWRPETSTLTVHKPMIYRGDKTIDILARDQNLKTATLDGVLTANIQPEGLQVGDLLELAVTITGADPALKGHVEQIGAFCNWLSTGGRSA